MRRRKYWPYVNLLLCVGLAALFIVYQRRSRVPSMLDGATRVAPVSGWWDEDDAASGGYYWVTNDRLLTTTGRWKDADPFCYDVSARRRIPQPRLKQLLHKSTEVTDLSLSPDRKWVVWCSEFDENIQAATLDGSRHITWNLPWCSGGVYWLDGRGDWICRKFDQSGGPPVAAWGSIYHPGTIHIAPERAARDLDDGRLPTEIVPGESPSLRQVSIYELDGKSSGVMGIPCSVIDASGNRIATLRMGIARPWWTPLSQPLHIPRPPARRGVELCVTNSSRMAGTGTRVVAQMELGSGNVDEFSEACPHNLCWLPDGKRVSFVYRGWLYVRWVGR
jgi:hypothetical protein